MLLSKKHHVKTSHFSKTYCQTAIYMYFSNNLCSKQGLIEDLYKILFFSQETESISQTWM